MQQQTSEALTLLYPVKQIPTADPQIIPDLKTSWLSNLRWGLCVVTLLFNAEVLSQAKISL